MRLEVLKAIRLPAFGLTFATLDLILILTTQFYVRGFLIVFVMLVSSLVYMYYCYKDYKHVKDTKLYDLRSTGIQ